MSSHFVARLAFAVLGAGAFAAIAQDAATSHTRQPVVVELFQSQGCSSCPPAEANLNAIAGKPGVLALSFGVTYWDDLGWKDTFARPQYTQRQYDYAHHHGRSQVWTPQVYIDGGADLLGTDRSRLDRAIAQAQSAGPAIAWKAHQLTVGSGHAATDCDVWLVRYDPRTVEVPIKAGENGGRTLPQRNVVRQLVKLGNWSGAARTFPLPAAAMQGLVTAVLVQEKGGGPILGASTQ